MWIEPNGYVSHHRLNLQTLTSSFVCYTLPVEMVRQNSLIYFFPIPCTSVLLSNSMMSVCFYFVDRLEPGGTGGKGESL